MVDRSQRVVPMLSYEDAGAAADWLVRAFGFVEQGERFVDDEGHVTHAELDAGGSSVMIAWTGPAYLSPDHHVEACDHARGWLDNGFVVDGALVYIDDLDDHLARAKSAGARILRGPDDAPTGRLYTAADLEGHRWMFLEPAG